MTRAIALTGLALMCLCSCGTTLDDYLEANEEFRCLSSRIARGHAPALAEAACGPDGVDSTTSLRSDLAKAVEDGRIAFDETKAAACVSALESLKPGDYWGPTANLYPRIEADAWELLDRGPIRPPSACDGVMTPKVTPSGACITSNECAGGVCTSTDAACLCVRLAEVGEGCPCRDGLFCRNRDLKCAMPLSNGDECNPGLDACDAGLFCPTGISEPHCTPKLPAGAECHMGSYWQFSSVLGSRECLGNQICVGLVRGAHGELVPGHCGTPSDVGESCATPFGTEGAGDSGCFIGLRCDGQTLKCVPFPDPGEACFDGTCTWDDRGDGVLCDRSVGGDGQCKSKKGDGESCEGINECRSTSSCVGGKCQQDPPLVYCPAQ